MKLFSHKVTKIICVGLLYFAFGPLVVAETPTALFSVVPPIMPQPKSAQSTIGIFSNSGRTNSASSTLRLPVSDNNLIGSNFSSTPNCKGNNCSGTVSIPIDLFLPPQLNILRQPPPLAPNVVALGSLGGFFNRSDFAIEEDLAAFVSRLVTNLVVSSIHLDDANKFSLYVGQPRTFQTIDGLLNIKTTTFAVVLPSEVINSEDYRRWLSFDIAIEHGVIPSNSGTFARIVIDKSRIAARSFFGFERKAPTPSEVSGLDASTNEEIDDRDRRIARIMNAHSQKMMALLVANPLMKGPDQ